MSEHLTDKNVALNAFGHKLSADPPLEDFDMNHANTYTDQSNIDATQEAPYGTTDLQDDPLAETTVQDGYGTVDALHVSMSMADQSLLSIPVSTAGTYHITLYHCLVAHVW